MGIAEVRQPREERPTLPLGGAGNFGDRPACNVTLERHDAATARRGLVTGHRTLSLPFIGSITRSFQSLSHRQRKQRRHWACLQKILDESQASSLWMRVTLKGLQLASSCHFCRWLQVQGLDLMQQNVGNCPLMYSKCSWVFIQQSSFFKINRNGLVRFNSLAKPSRDGQACLRASLTPKLWLTKWNWRNAKKSLKTSSKCS